MAAPHTSTDYADEKQEVHYVEHSHESPTVSSHELQKERTLEGIDMNNTSAVKGDDSDGKVEWSTRSIFAAIFLAALYTGSQVILYFTGGSLGFIAEDLGLEHGSAWLPTANILAIAATCPYAGYLQDLFGKRYIALFGSLCICVGCALVGSGHSFAQLLAGMAISGVGAAIGELTGLAGLAEIVPVKYRGYSLALVTAFVLPFCPYLIYVEMWSHHGTKRIDYVGGVLSIIGLTLFLVTLQAGGYTHPWRSGYVLGTLIVGLGLIALFKGQRIVGLAYVVAFAAGMNFFSILNFFPVTFTNVYDPIPLQIGLRGLAPAFTTAIGAIVFNAALSKFPNHTREVLLFAVVLMTGFAGSLAVMTPENQWLVVGVGSVASFGVGGVLVPAATVAMLVCPDALITTAAAMSLSIRTVGGSIGYSIYYNIFATKLEKNLPKYVVEYAVKAGLPLSSATQFVTLFLTAPKKLAITLIAGVTPAVIASATKGTQWAFSESLKYVWFTSIAFGGMAIVCTILLPSTEKYQTNRVAVQIS
ncbi:MFS general substrate transporter [Setomelanomma holmii]|uniref:MFS general substrate transporter n=1 Tax=Setomelanomma holmii TaxID=210430 RepID=A0A9P4GZZ1_9PLEO|nr:MFS general substrate transporter [Setomelanomma holmii]